MKTIILCGLPRCGKTTIGKRLAEKLNWQFIDTDQQIEKNYLIQTRKKMSCRDMYLIEGEKRFRELEKEQITALKPEKECVIALGGGSLIDEENRQHLRQVGRLVYLNISPQTLWERIQKEGIPAFLNSDTPEWTFYEVARTRSLVYQQAADITIEINEQSVEEILETFIRMIHCKEENL